MDQHAAQDGEHADGHGGLGALRGMGGCRLDAAEGAGLRIGFWHRRHTSVLTATRSCPERGTSDGLSSGVSPGLMLRRTALRGASAGLRHSACATSARRSRGPFAATIRRSSSRLASTRREEKGRHLGDSSENYASLLANVMVKHHAEG